MSQFLTDEQIKLVTEWLCTWEQIKYGAIPIRFKDEFKKSKEEIEKGIEFSNNIQELWKKGETYVFPDKIETSEILDPNGKVVDL